jgi:hypothetical protein
VARVTRLNIYLPDAEIRRLVKAAAARRDISVSEYCVRAITAQLAREGERLPGKQPSLKTAVAAARAFQKKTFDGVIFSVSSAELIREARMRR